MEDLGQVYGLIKELAHFEEEPGEPTISPEQFESDFEKFYESLIAEKDGKIIGIALYYWGYSTWKGKLLYLDDLVIGMEHRKSGVGSTLFNHIIYIAKKENAGQVRWQVLDWNKIAIDMYKKAKADFHTNWLTCKMERDSIENYQPI